jgi:uncharacterized membrane protein
MVLRVRNPWPIKASNPVEVAKYAMKYKLVYEPALVWWVRCTLKKCMLIVAAVSKRYTLHLHKFGVELPKSCEDKLAIDAATNTS